MMLMYRIDPSLGELVPQLGTNLAIARLMIGTLTGKQVSQLARDRNLCLIIEVLAHRTGLFNLIILTFSQF
jgi:hypothetical protein